MLTPIDIQNREIKSKMGGYDKKDVMTFWRKFVAVMRSCTKKIKA